MIDLSKITREDMSTLPNKKGLLKERRDWLKKQRKKDRYKAHNAYAREIRKLGYEGTRELHSFTITISKCNHLIFTVRELRSGEIVINNHLYQYE